MGDKTVPWGTPVMVILSLSVSIFSIVVLY